MQSLTLMFGVVAALVAATVQVARAQVDDVIRELTGRGHALLIGVSAYNDVRWPQLPSTRGDIARLKEGLAPHFTQIDTLPDPTANEIRDALRNLFQTIGSDPNQRIFVFYAGHGFTDQNDAAREDYGYITGRDTPEYGNNRRGAISRAIPMVEIDAIARSAAARHALIVFDSCFSGTIFENRAPIVRSTQALRELLRQPVRSYISAGGPTQRVPANSPIATLLLRGIQGEADKYQNGYVTGTDLGVYLQNIVPGMTGNLIKPQFGKSPNAAFTGGEFVFIKRFPPPAGNTATQSPQLAVSRPVPSPSERRPVYLAFFDRDQDATTESGMHIIKQAADEWKARGGIFLVTGYDERSLPPADSQRLSEHRANNVAYALERYGVPRSAMVVSGRGQNDNRVPTAAGVPEPQNRRVEIVFR